MKAHLTWLGQPSCSKSTARRFKGAFGGYHELVDVEAFEKILRTQPDYACRACLRNYRRGKYDKNFPWRSEVRGNPPFPVMDPSDPFERQMQEYEDKLVKKMNQLGISWRRPRRGEAAAFMLLRDRNGREIDVVMCRSDGTIEGSMDSANKLTDLLDEMGHEYNGVQSFTGATDKSGKTRWVISPNRKHIAEIGTDEARSILGDMEAFARIRKREARGNPEDFPWVIYNREYSKVEEEPMYWCNEIGWVSLPDATRFSDVERRTLHLPVGGEWRRIGHKHSARGNPESFYTISRFDIGRPYIRAFGQTWLTSSFIGRILPRDVGKRVYLVGADDPMARDFLQVENDEQFNRRRSREGFTRFNDTPHRY